MRRSSVLLAGLAMALTAGAAQAQQMPHQNGTKIGVGMICDSQAQAARFIELREKGNKPHDAMAVVNREARNKQACGLATIAFTRDATLTSKAIDNKLVQVVRINVVAGFVGSGWQHVSGFVQYAVVEAEGIEV